MEVGDETLQGRWQSSCHNNRGQVQTPTLQGDSQATPLAAMLETYLLGSVLVHAKRQLSRPYLSPRLPPFNCLTSAFHEGDPNLHPTSIQFVLPAVTQISPW